MQVPIVTPHRSQLMILPFVAGVSRATNDNIDALNTDCLCVSDVTNNTQATIQARVQAKSGSVLHAFCNRRSNKRPRQS